MDWIEPTGWTDPQRAKPLLVTDSTDLWRFRRHFAARGVAVLRLDSSGDGAELARTMARLQVDVMLVACADPAGHVDTVITAAQVPPLCLVHLGRHLWWRAADPQLRERMLSRKPVSCRQLVTDAIELTRFMQMLRHYTAPAADLAAISEWLGGAPAGAPVAFASRRIHPDRPFPVHGFRWWLHSMARDVGRAATAAFCVDAPWGDPATLHLWRRVREAMDDLGIHPVPGAGAMLERSRPDGAAWRVIVGVTAGAAVESRMPLVERVDHGRDPDAAPPPDVAVAHRGEQARILLIENGGLAGQIQTGLARIELHDWAEDGRLAVLLDRSRCGWREVRILRVEDRRVAVEARIPTPIPATDLLWSGRQLVICGHSETQPRAWITDPATQSAWQPLPMPDGELWARKGFDALVMRGDHLIALDNIVRPKWMVHYRVGVNRIPELTGISPLATNGAYEHVVSARCGKSMFAVLSTSIGKIRGPRVHITLYTWNDAAILATHTLPRGPWQYAMEGDDFWLLGPPSTKDTRADLSRLFRYRTRRGTEECKPESFRSAGIEGAQLVTSSFGALHVVSGDCTQLVQPEQLVGE